ncbi:hypothetical protein GQ42DRAFT_157182 [Ramicandelaber brevisporus]|nr:hypothetical protein GQ42DRAFT_157182 [Ramicandelaber brevisporus]
MIPETIDQQAASQPPQDQFQQVALADTALFRLPTELLSHICEFLPLQAQAVVCRLCKQLRPIGLRAVYRQPCFDRFWMAAFINTGPNPQENNYAEVKRIFQLRRQHIANLAESIRFDACFSYIGTNAKARLAELPDCSRKVNSLIFDPSADDHSDLALDILEKASNMLPKTLRQLKVGLTHKSDGQRWAAALNKHTALNVLHFTINADFTSSTPAEDANLQTLFTSLQIRPKRVHLHLQSSLPEATAQAIGTFVDGRLASITGEKSTSPTRQPPPPQEGAVPGATSHGTIETAVANIMNHIASSARQREASDRTFPGFMAMPTALGTAFSQLGSIKVNASLASNDNINTAILNAVDSLETLTLDSGSNPDGTDVRLPAPVPGADGADAAADGDGDANQNAANNAIAANNAANWLTQPWSNLRYLDLGEVKISEQPEGTIHATTSLFPSLLSFKVRIDGFEPVMIKQMLIGLSPNIETLALRINSFNVKSLLTAFKEAWCTPAEAGQRDPFPYHLTSLTLVDIGELDPYVSAEEVQEVFRDAIPAQYRVRIEVKATSKPEARPNLGGAFNADL